MFTTILAAGIGLVLAGLATYLGSLISKRVGLVHWLVNLLLGALSAVAASQLLAGAYGPVIAGLSVVPMLTGALILVGISTWILGKLANRN